MEDNQLKDFEEAYDWVRGGLKSRPILILGNGFSMAYDPARFSYSALADLASLDASFPPNARALMQAEATADFERIMRRLDEASQTLAAIDREKYQELIDALEHEVTQLREALATAIAALHPDRPHEINSNAYERVRQFLDRFHRIFSVNYDLLLYWTLMQEFDNTEIASRVSDDGFRDSGIDGDETVLWNIYDTGGQIVYYLHGALHLFEGSDGLRKITFTRTNKPLIEQIREQLSERRYPLYVAEGTSASKLKRINESGYLTRGLRSIPACRSGTLVFGHSLDHNDDHVFEAIVRGKTPRIAISIYGDPNSLANVEIRSRGDKLAIRRLAYNEKQPLAVEYFSAESVELW